MHRYRVVVSKIADTEIANTNSPDSCIVEGVIFDDGLTIMKWKDGSQGIGIYPNPHVIAGIHMDSAELDIIWLDGVPTDI